MKILNYLFLVALMLNSASAQNVGAWYTTIKVINETGQPVVNATAQMQWYVNAPDGTLTFDQTEGLTDTNGIFTTSHKANGSITLGFFASKTGYYSTGTSHQLATKYYDDPAKWNHNVTLLLKKVGKPVAMYAKRLNTHAPDLDKPIGFDLELGDWVAPYGRGVNSDINFTGHFDKHADGESDFTLTVGFPKDGDGIKEFYVPEAELGGGLRSPNEAPKDGYKPQWVQTDNRKPGKPIETNQDPNRNYLFRVRTVKDHEGNIVSAHYGKIYGDFMQFTYYLNPTPNDRNIEFNPKQNLLQGLQSFEQVAQP